MICYMTETDLPVAFDTNLLVYAFDTAAGLRQELAYELLEDVLSGEIRLFITTQIVSEFFVNITAEKKRAAVENPLSISEAEGTIRDILSLPNVSLAELSFDTIFAALSLKKVTGASYWDCLIAATMKEHGITTIYTEDKGFEKIEGIKAVNPFEKRT